MANGVYTAGLLKLLEEGLAAQSVRALLIDDAGSYVFDPDHASLTELDLGTNELTAALNYERKTLAMVAASGDDTNDRVSIDASPIVWEGLGETDGETVAAMVLYLYVDGTAANDVPFLYLDNSAAPLPANRLPRQTNGGDFTVTWNTAGIVTVKQEEA